MLIVDVEAGEHENYFMVEEEGQEPKGFNWTRIPLVPFKYNKQEMFATITFSCLTKLKISTRATLIFSSFAPWTTT